MKEKKQSDVSVLLDYAGNYRTDACGSLHRLLHRAKKDSGS